MKKFFVLKISNLAVDGILEGSDETGLLHRNKHSAFVVELFPGASIDLKMEQLLLAVESENPRIRHLDCHITSGT
jgi:hypothetical protein